MPDFGGVQSLRTMRSSAALRLAARMSCGEEAFLGSVIGSFPLLGSHALHVRLPPGERA
jgi:hypothetical protein